MSITTVHYVNESPTAITNLLYRYAELMDAGQLEACADLFTHARVLLGDPAIGEPPVVNRDGLVAVWRAMVRIHEDGTPRTRHLVATPIIDVDEEAGTATCRSTYTVFQQVGPGPLQPVISGQYLDRFAKVDGSWRFAERAYVMDLIGDLSQHVIGDLPNTSKDAGPS